MLIGNGTSAITSVAPSTSGNVLTSTGSAWASQASAGGGKVLAVVQFTKTDTASTTSTSATATGLAVTTGTLTSGSKVLVQVSINVGNSTTEQRTHITLWNGVTQLFLGDSGTGHQSTAWMRSWDAYSIYNIAFMYLHDCEHA